MSRPVALVIAFALLVPTFLRADPPPASQPVYTSCKPSQDGIGKVYMGREIAQVMGHAGIGSPRVDLAAHGGNVLCQST